MDDPQPRPIAGPDWRERVKPGSFLAWLAIADLLSYAFLVQGMRNVVGQDLDRLPFSIGVTWVFCLLVSALMAAFCRFAQRPMGEGEGRPRAGAWILGAWWAGSVVGLGASAIHIRGMGWVVVPQVLAGNLGFFPAVLAAALGFQFWAFPGTGIGTPAPGARPRITWPLLLTIAASIVLVNLSILATRRIGDRARTFQARYATHDGQAKTYGRMQRELEPEGASYRESVVRLGNLAEYHRSLAEVYDRARVRPWDPVAADPPPPR